MSSRGPPVRILFVFAWLVVGGEETEVRLLAGNLDRARYRIDVVACFRSPNMPLLTHDQLTALGVDVDTTPYELSLEDTIDYLACKIPGYDVVISCQNVADIYPALDRIHLRPPLIEHGGLVCEALAGPKHFTSRYIGVCRSIRDAAASIMLGREQDALEIPSMVDLSEFDASQRLAMRASLGVAEDSVLIGWAGRLDPKKNVEDFIEAAALVHAHEKSTRFVIAGGPDAFMPDYALRLHALAKKFGLGGALIFLGDRKDVPALLSSFDIFAWLSKGEGMPHVIAEAGAAALPVIATPDNGARQQIEDEVSGLFVPYSDPVSVARAMNRLTSSPDLRKRLGQTLRSQVERSFSVAAVLPQWERVIREVIAERRKAEPTGIFKSFFQGGFECSTHRLQPREGEVSGKRLDMIAATRHDINAAADYAQLASHAIRTVRDGVRWHLIEAVPEKYDWASFLPMLTAARETGTQVIWDLLHYGWPDDIDIWSPEFVTRFAAFAGATASVVRQASDVVPFYVPVNEISFFAWAGGDVGYLNPFTRGRGFELKVQLARASIAAMKAVLAVDSRARFVHCDPVINVVADPSRPWDRQVSQGHCHSQYQGWDLLAGRMWPQIGGSKRYLDIVGVNYYHNNQWVHGATAIDVDHPLHKPLRTILYETYARYGRPMLIAETGIEAEKRGPWMRYIYDEVNAAADAGVPIEAICLYPIVNHPGWDDDRPCENGLLSAVPSEEGRSVYEPLARVLGEISQGGLTYSK